MHSAKMAKPHCVFVPAAGAAGCDLSVLLAAFMPIPWFAMVVHDSDYTDFSIFYYFVNN